MPSFQDDPEHQIYQEAVSRTAAQAATFSPYRALVLIVLNRTTTKVGVRGIVASKNRP
jgi:hypothetical protein